MKSAVIESPLPMGKYPDIIDLHYAGHLTIRIDPGIGKGQIEVFFDKPHGFRCLDEGDLSYWDDKTLVDNWFFEITDGGWLRLEHGGQLGISSTTPQMREFLICSSNDCVTVLSPSPPILRVIPNSEQDAGLQDLTRRESKAP
jgi:hypothetical protein